MAKNPSFVGQVKVVPDGVLDVTMVVEALVVPAVKVVALVVVVVEAILRHEAVS